MRISRNHAQKLVGLILVPGDLMNSGLPSRPFRQRLSPSGRFLIRLRFAIIAALVLNVVFSMPQSATAQSTFTNPTRITISDDLFLEASPYPSNITVSGLSGSVSKVTVTLTDLNFGFPRDVDILLVGPNGQSVILMSDARGDGTGHIINKTLTFDDAALLPLPSDSTLTSGTYKPTNFDSEVDFFSAPAPAGPYGTTLSVFNGTTPNGTWSLYMVDDLFDDPFGELPQEITGGWSLAVTTQNPISNPIDDAQFFVRQQYLDFLNRPADDLGLAFWTNEITSCGTDAQCIDLKRTNVSAAFFLSIEFQETGYLVYRIYKAAYGDTTSPNVAIPVPIIRLNEFLPDAQQIGQGVQVGIGNWETQLENNKSAYAREFVVRQRFLSAYPLTMTAGQFVDKLNESAGGVLSQSERDQLVAELDAAMDVTQGRASVVRKVAEDADLRQRETNRAFVLMQYYGYLRRNPDDPQDTDFRGWEFWLNKLNQHNGNFGSAEMVTSFLVSIEYRQRFGQP